MKRVSIMIMVVAFVAVATAVFAHGPGWGGRGCMMSARIRRLLWYSTLLGIDCCGYQVLR